jgi:hypothetical protein
VFPRRQEGLDIILFFPILDVSMGFGSGSSGRKEKICTSSAISLYLRREAPAEFAFPFELSLLNENVLLINAFYSDRRKQYLL